MSDKNSLVNMRKRQLARALRGAILEKVRETYPTASTVWVTYDHEQRGYRVLQIRGPRGLKFWDRTHDLEELNEWRFVVDQHVDLLMRTDLSSIRVAKNYRISMAFPDYIIRYGGRHRYSPELEEAGVGG